MKGKKINLIVQKESNIESKIADGYNKTKTVIMHGSYDFLTVKVAVSGDPDDVDKALKKLKLAKLDRQCTMVLSEFKSPQTSLDDQLDLEEDKLEDEDE